MDFSFELTELKQLKKNQDTIDKLDKILSDSKEIKDSSLTLEILKYKIDCLRFMRSHDLAIFILEQEINSDYFSDKEERLQLMDELIKILLKTEDFFKLESVLLSRERFLSNEHQKVMQKFYLAVCYEGMKQYKKAIDSLKNIKDIISSSNLVSKYLKLSMLYLKEGNLTLAKENLEHAGKFDRQRLNPIFALAESDILYYEEDYLNALAKYQEYFIKSKNKRRYLDRFILINIELNLLDDAWRFYQEYLPTMSSIISKNYRLVFYQAALKLAKLLKNPQEVEKLEFLIDELAPEAALPNEFDNVYRLLSIAFENKNFKQPRDIVHHLFKAIDSLYKFQKLIFIEADEQYANVLHFTKNLLLEKTLNRLSISETVLEQILESKPVNDLYTYDDLIAYSHSVYKTVETKYVFANGIEQIANYGYFIVYSKDRDQFDFQQKLVLLASEILKKLLNDFSLRKTINEQLDHYKTLSGLSDGGLIKIENNTIHFLNQKAKDLLKCQLDYLAFEEFQKSLKESIFIDDFLYTEKLELTIKGDLDSQRVSFDISKSDFTIFALVRAVVSDQDKRSINHFLNLPDEKQLLSDNHSTAAKSIILFDIRNYLDYFKDYNYQNYQKKLRSLIDFIKISSRGHFDEVYLESYNLIYLSIKTTDKRVTKRISDTIVKTFNDFKIRVAIIQINHSLSHDKLVQLRYLDSLTEDSRYSLYDNKNFRYNQELSKTLLLNVRQFIDKKSLPLSFKSYEDWQNQISAFWNVEIAESAMLGETNSLRSVIKAADLENEWDYLQVTSLMKLLKNGNSDRSFVLELFKESLLDNKQLQRIVRKVGTTKVLFMVDLEQDFDLEELKAAKEFLVSKGIFLIAYNFSQKINLQDYCLFEYFDYLIIDKADLERKNFVDFLSLLNKFALKFIYNHHHESLKRSQLVDLNISYVYGSVSKKHDNVTALN